MPDATLAPAILSTACLDAVVLRHWHKGVRQDFTGRQFWRLVAAHMASLEGVSGEGGVSLVLGHTSPDQIALFVALMAGGRLAALFPPNTPLQDEAAYFAQQRASFAKIDPVCIIITEDRLAETIRRVDPGFGARILLVAPGADAVLAGDGGAEEAAMAAFRARLESAAPIFVQHSSGTTGIKKAVAISGQALVAQFNAYWPGVRAACGAERLRIASWLPLYHDMGLITSVLLPLLGGDTVSITDAFEWIASPGLLFTMIAEDGCDVTWLPNFAFRHLIRLRPGFERHAGVDRLFGAVPVCRCGGVRAGFCRMGRGAGVGAGMLRHGGDGVCGDAMCAGGTKGAGGASGVAAWRGCGGERGSGGGG